MREINRKRREMEGRHEGRHEGSKVKESRMSYKKWKERRI